MGRKLANIIATKMNKERARKQQNRPIAQYSWTSFKKDTIKFFSKLVKFIKDDIEKTGKNTKKVNIRLNLEKSNEKTVRLTKQKNKNINIAFGKNRESTKTTFRRSVLKEEVKKEIRKEMGLNNKRSQNK